MTSEETISEVEAVRNECVSIISLAPFNFSTNQNFGDAKNLMILMNVALGAEYSLKQETSLIAELYIKNGITHAWKDHGDVGPYETFLFNQFGISLGFLF